jgi:hypothetical protein
MKSVFFKDLPDSLTVSLAEKASIVARITVVQATNGQSVTGTARVDEIIKGSLHEKTVRFVAIDTTTCHPLVWSGSAGIAIGNLMPDGTLSLVSAPNRRIDPTRY